MIKATPSLGFSDAINTSTSRIFQFQGRTRRSEFWWTQFLVFVSSIILTPIFGALLDLLTIPLIFRRLHDTGRSGWWWGFGALLKLGFCITVGYDCFMIIINDGHFDGHEGLLAMNILKYSLFVIGICIFQFLLFVFCCIDSDKSENKYGASPKYVDEADEDAQTTDAVSE